LAWRRIEASRGSPRAKSLYIENAIRDLTGLEQHDSIGELTDVGIAGPSERNNPALVLASDRAHDVAAVALGICAGASAINSPSPSSFRTKAKTT
jgi:hypothetical protein